MVNYANFGIMRLSKEQVEKISGLILKRLKDRDLIVLKAEEKKVLEKINEVIMKDIRAEEALDKEVEEMIRTHSGSVDIQKLDYRKMFNMIKGKLARERGIVL